MLKAIVETEEICLLERCEAVGVDCLAMERIALYTSP